LRPAARAFARDDLRPTVSREKRHDHGRQRAQRHRGTPAAEAVRPPAQRADLLREILLHGEDRGHDQQHDHHAEAQTVDQRDHRGFQELRILRPLVEQRREAQHRRQRRQKHGPQPVAHPVDDRRDQAARLGLFVDGGHQHDGIVDDDPRHPDQADHREHGSAARPSCMCP
jgi:hypothetical protein